MKSPKYFINTRFLTGGLMNPEIQYSPSHTWDKRGLAEAASLLYYSGNPVICQSTFLSPNRRTTNHPLAPAVRDAESRLYRITLTAGRPIGKGEYERRAKAEALFTKLLPGLELSEIHIKDDGWIRRTRALTGWQAPFNVLFKVGFNSTSIKTAPSSIHIFIERAGRREEKRNHRGGGHIQSLQARLRRVLQASKTEKGANPPRQLSILNKDFVRDIAGGHPFLKGTYDYTCDTDSVKGSRKAYRWTGVALQVNINLGSNGKERSGPRDYGITGDPEVFLGTVSHHCSGQTGWSQYTSFCDVEGGTSSKGMELQLERAIQSHHEGDVLHQQKKWQDGTKRPFK
ncbi:hypothetical protein ARMSODRAFT_983756 [Armillaria solidipes]|uniref:Uncharacterized protein n=1 Tax=Armillaria solidipes TaxID=1076256 RepID=A0A2H3AP73_9AGAR|nr:hypothetical protein ARMSODRAFT_983756 [Armillaria solidipes]